MAGVNHKKASLSWMPVPDGSGTILRQSADIIEELFGITARLKLFHKTDKERELRMWGPPLFMSQAYGKVMQEVIKLGSKEWPHNKEAIDKKEAVGNEGKTVAVDKTVDKTVTDDKTVAVDKTVTVGKTVAVDNKGKTVTLPYLMVDGNIRILNLYNN